MSVELWDVRLGGGEVKMTRVELDRAFCLCRVDTTTPVRAPGSPSWEPYGQAIGLDVAPISLSPVTRERMAPTIRSIPGRRAPRAASSRILRFAVPSVLVALVTFTVIQLAPSRALRRIGLGARPRPPPTAVAVRPSPTEPARPPAPEPPPADPLPPLIVLEGSPAPSASGSVASAPAARRHPRPGHSKRRSPRREPPPSGDF